VCGRIEAKSNSKEVETMKETIVIYDATYANQEKTITTDMQEIVLFVRDTYQTANVNVWVNGNCVAAIEIKSLAKQK
jgi:hypothetical protein